MDLLFCLEDILSYFRPLFNTQNFALFKALVFGFIANTHEGTLTRLYQSSFSEQQYWSWTKFLSRGKWDADAVAARLIERLQQAFPTWVYVSEKVADRNCVSRCQTAFRFQRVSSEIS